MAGELSLDRQIEWAEAAVSEAQREMGRLLNELSARVQITQRRFEGNGDVAGNAPQALAGLVNQLDRCRAVLWERRGRLRQLKSWKEQGS